MGKAALDAKLEAKGEKKDAARFAKKEARLDPSASDGGNNDGGKQELERSIQVAAAALNHLGLGASVEQSRARPS